MPSAKITNNHREYDFYSRIWIFGRRRNFGSSATLVPGLVSAHGLGWDQHSRAVASSHVRSSGRNRGRLFPRPRRRLVYRRSALYLARNRCGSCGCSPGGPSSARARGASVASSGCRTQPSSFAYSPHPRRVQRGCRSARSARCVGNDSNQVRSTLENSNVLFCVRLRPANDISSPARGCARRNCGLSLP